MERVSRSNSDVIFETESFIFRRTHGVGVNNTPWTGLNVVSQGLADKYAVEIRLTTVGNPEFDGTPVNFTYLDDGTYVAYGLPCSGYSRRLSGTIEFIHVLEDAVDFAERVNHWLQENHEGTV